MKKFAIFLIFFNFCFMNYAKAEEDYHSLLQKAYKMVKSRNYPSAYALFKKALKYDNTQVDLYYNLSEVGAGIKSCTDAIIFMTGYLYLNPSGEDAKSIQNKKKNCEKTFKKSGTLTIMSDPAGIEMMLENAIIGKTPINGMILEKGSYNISLRNIDFEDIDKPVTIEEGKETKVEIKLTKKMTFGQLELTITPAEGVQVFIDDQFFGETPLKEKLITLKTKDYLLKLTKNGYDQWIRYITINRDKVTKIEVNMEKTPQKSNLPQIKQKK